MRYLPHLPGQQASTRLLRAWRVTAPLAIYILALLTRLDFVLNRPQVPANFGDQAGYQVAAETVANGLRLYYPDRYGSPAEQPDDLNVFDREYRQVFYDATARNGIWPLLLVPAYFSADPLQAIQVAQAVLFATLPLAVLLITRRVTTPSLGGLAGLLTALYPPLIVSTGRFLHQGPATLLIAWGLVCLLSWRKDQAAPWRIVAGYLLLTLAGYVLLVVRPLLLVLLVAWPVGRVRPNRLVKWGYLGAWGAAIVLWSLATSGYRHGDLGNELLKTSLGLSQNNLSVIDYNIGSFLHSDLWRSDDTFLPAQALPEQQSLFDLLRADPLNTLGGILTNSMRFFAQPYNDFAQPYLLDYDGQAALHQALLLLAALGLFVSLGKPTNGRGKLVVFTLLMIGLLLAIYATTHIEARYLSVLTPAQVALAAVGIHWLIKQATPRQWAALLALLLLNALISVPNLLTIFPAMPPATAHALDALALGALWIVGGALLLPAWTGSARVSRGVGSRQVPTAWIMRAVAVGIAVIVSLGTWWDSNWRGWTDEIAPGERVQQILTLGDFTPPPGTVPVLLLDVGQPAQEPNLTILVNGSEVKAQWVPLQSWAATRGADELAFSYSYDIFRRVSGGYLPDFRRWGFMPLDPALWAGSPQIEIELVGTGMDPVTLWGDYVDDPGVLVGPSLSPWDDSRALFRLQWDKDDRRVTVTTPLPPVAYRAQRGLGSGDSLTWSEDLSAAPGWQSGRYRVYVLWVAPEDMPAYNPP